MALCACLYGPDDPRCCSHPHRREDDDLEYRPIAPYRSYEVKLIITGRVTWKPMPIDWDDDDADNGG